MIGNIITSCYMILQQNADRRRCGNEEESIVFSVRLDIFKHMVKKRSLILDMANLFVEEGIMVQICYKCHKYGHTRKFCPAEQVCHHCGGTHGEGLPGD